MQLKSLPPVFKEKDWSECKFSAMTESERLTRFSQLSTVRFRIKIKLEVIDLEEFELVAAFYMLKIMRIQIEISWTTLN